MKELYFNKGIKYDQVDQLVEFARTDDAVRKNTSDPKRFANRESYMDWLGNGKKIYTLSDAQGDLKGLIWFGMKDMPTNKVEGLRYPFTFAIRTYGDARGNGFAGAFAEEAIEDFRGANDDGIWLEVSADNEPAIKLDNRLGFNQITEADAKGKILMTLD